MPIIIPSRGLQNVGQIQKQFVCGNLFLSPEEYQRENALRLPQKQLLIDTKFRGMNNLKHYLWKVNQYTLTDGHPDGETKTLYKEILDKKRTDNDDPDPHLFEVDDGQQRIMMSGERLFHWRTSETSWRCRETSSSGLIRSSSQIPLRQQ